MKAVNERYENLDHRSEYLLDKLQSACVLESTFNSTESSMNKWLESAEEHIIGVQQTFSATKNSDLEVWHSYLLFIF